MRYLREAKVRQARSHEKLVGRYLSFAPGSSRPWRKRFASNFLASMRGLNRLSVLTQDLRPGLLSVAP